MIYAALFLSALASATLLPGSSEVALLGLLAAGQGEPLLLVAAATAGNVLGSLANWALGRYGARLRHHPRLAIQAGTYDRATAWFGRYGVWCLLLSWVPVMGDALTLAAGLLGVRAGPFLLLVTIGKAGRYLALLAAFQWWPG